MIRREFETGGNISPDHRARQHHTLFRKGTILDMTYAGLHEDQAGANKARQLLAEDKRNSKWGNAEIIELEVGQEYNPFGTEVITYTHGVDDGTHGAVLKNSYDKNILAPRTKAK